MQIIDTDLIIVGGGGAGMCAALKAQRRGLRCILLEADDKLGGATALSAGVYAAAGSRHQRVNGITDDSPAEFYEYVTTLNRMSVRPEIVRLLCDRAVEGLEFLIACGVAFPDDYLVGGGRWRVARGHSCSREGGTIAEILADRVRETRVDVRLNTRADTLVIEEGRVVGVRAGGTEFRGRAVALTTGGFGNNKELLARLYPSAAQHGDWVWATAEAARHVQGDGILMAERIGASITGHDTGLVLPISGFGHGIESVLPPWLILVNSDGRRFMSETSSYSTSGYLINEQRNAVSYAIFDEKTLRESSDDTSYADPSKQRMAVPSWHQESLRREAANGRVKTAGTIAALAAEIGVSPRALSATVARYNADCERGVDGAFLKSPAGLLPIREPPFYAVEVRAALVGLTAAGLEIDTRARVLDVDGCVIPGLYAAGEVLGGIFGDRYPVGGFSIATAVVFGCLAGECAAEEIQADFVGAAR